MRSYEHPARVAAVAGARRPKRDAVAILDRDAAPPSRANVVATAASRPTPRSPPTTTPITPPTTFAARPNARPIHLPPLLGVTTNVPPSLRPLTPGLYISSACAGGLRNVPGRRRAREIGRRVRPGQRMVAE